MDEHKVILNGYSGCKMVGRGTQGSVYKAFTRTEPKSAVAIKVISKNNLSKTGRNNLVTEIGLLKKLKHKFIVDLVDFHWDEKYIYIVMEYCDGGDLSSVIQQRKCLPEIACKRFLQQLASALQYLRQHNVSHMDLKPSNLLIKGSNPPILKVADFGFAQHLEENSKDRGLKGSPLYMAPEIFLADQYDAKADLWSIGVILYEALFGKAPFSSGTIEQLVVKIKEDVPVVIPKSRSISAECRDLLASCLIRCPEKRIGFQDFFAHPFLDLQHLPDENSFQKASMLVTQAVAADRARDTEAAARLYAESLAHFLPLLHYEEDAGRREQLAARVATYQRRLAQLRERDQPRQLELVAVCRPSPALLTGVEICVQGEEYLASGQTDMALDRITSGLGVLVPALQQEPKGKRRDMLKKEVTHWMETAEKLKQSLSRGHQHEEADVATEATDGQGKSSCRLQ